MEETMVDKEITLGDLRKELSDLQNKQTLVVKNIAELKETLQKDYDDLTEDKIQNVEKAIDAFNDEYKGYNEKMTSLKLEIKAAEELKHSREKHTGNITASVLQDKKLTDSQKEDAFRKAFVEAVKGNDAEYKKFLSTADTDGTTADAFGALIPTFVASEIQTKMEEYGTLFAKANITTVKGLMSFPVEVNATDAVKHKEGSGAISDEEITLEEITVRPAMIKKAIEWSDELELSTPVNLLSYLINEFTRKIVQKIEVEMLSGEKDQKGLEGIIHYIEDDRYVHGKAIDTPEFTDISFLISRVRGTNPIIVMNRATYFTYVDLTDTAGRPIFTEVSNNNGVTYLLRGTPVKFNDLIPSFEDATLGQPYAICMVDNAYKINAPDGTTPSFIVDRVTKMREDKASLMGKCFLGGRPTKLDGITVLTKTALPTPK
jgi:HK97 family phage major capsid protein